MKLRRGKPVVKWKDRMKEYMHGRIPDRGGEIELARMECVDRERRRLFCRGHHLGGRFRRERLNEASETINRSIAKAYSSNSKTVTVLTIKTYV